MIQGKAYWFYNVFEVIFVNKNDEVLCQSMDGYVDSKSFWIVLAGAARPGGGHPRKSKNFGWNFSQFDWSFLSNWLDFLPILEFSWLIFSPFLGFYWAFFSDFGEIYEIRFCELRRELSFWGTYATCSHSEVLGYLEFSQKSVWRPSFFFCSSVLSFWD
jgi:hypothetical protein